MDGLALPRSGSSRELESGRHSGRDIYDRFHLRRVPWAELAEWQRAGWERFADSLIYDSPLVERANPDEATAQPEAKTK